MPPRRQSSREVRRRLIETADRLFYAEGFRGVGVDRIVQEAGVAKMSLYHHFHSKDDLILAVLEHRGEAFDLMFNRFTTRHTRLGRDPLQVFFAALHDWFRSASFRGCMFVNARVELGHQDHPAAQCSASLKARFHRRLTLAVESVAGPRVAQQTTPALTLLVEGAIITAVMERSAHPARVAGTAAEALVRAAQAG